MKKIEIMGCGYIGLPTAVTFTLAGYEVCGFDINETVVEQLNGGHIHIVEPGLQEAMTQQDICSVYALPKQTVNTIVAGMVRGGYALLERSPDPGTGRSSG